jgi:NADH-quinone oxidoreductase subunit G
MSRRNHEVDDGWLCDRGRYGFDIYNAPDRIFKPHIRRETSLEPCTWDEALIVVAKHLRKVIDTNRGTEVAAVGSGMLSNEEAFAIRQFFNDIIKTAEIDFQTDTDRPVETEIIDIVGLEGTIQDLENDRLFIIIGADPAVEEPVATLKIKKAVSVRGAQAVFIGSYDKRLGNFPIANIRIPYGAEGRALEYLSDTLEGGSARNDFGLDTAELGKLAELIKREGRTHIIAGRIFFHHPDRREFLSALLRLRQLAGAKLSILPPQGNYMGVSHFGLYGDIDHSFAGILERINAGEIKALFVFGSNPVEEYPNMKYVQETLKKLEFLVVVAPFLHATASLAGVVFPQALPPDYGGTFTNIEGRIQLFQPMFHRPRHNVRPAWGILGEIADLIDLGRIWYHDGEIRAEIAKLLKGMEELVHIPVNGFLFPFRNYDEMKPRPVDLSPLPEAPAGRPYVLQYYPSVHHDGWLTEKSQNLMRIAGQQTVLMHPDDAAREGISDNQEAVISNNGSSITLPMRSTAHVNRGEILIINSFSVNPVNKIMSRGEAATFVSVKGA